MPPILDEARLDPLRRRPWLRQRCLVAAAVAVLAASACGATSNTDAANSIPPQDSELVARGADLYEARCAECHGIDLRGTDKGPSHLSEVYEPSHHADGAFILAIQRGSPEHHWRFGDMPRIDGLDGDDIAAVTAFVREQQRIEGFEPYPP